MIHISGEMNVVYDIDQTLILHDKGNTSITDPYTGTTKLYQIHTKHVELLKQHKNRGYQVFVWSNGGDKWAKAVIEALGLTDHVDYVMTKMCKFVDDTSADKVLGNHVYLDHVQEKQDEKFIIPYGGADGVPWMGR